jgi:predicted N-acetyltransferase YhbS
MRIELELSADADPIDRLLDHAFGAKRRAKTVYRLRQGVQPLHDLCFVARSDSGNEKGLSDAALIGSIRYWPIMIGASVPALLLGPVAINPDHRGQGVGTTLIRHSLEAARKTGHGIVILVGDAAYYQRFGFQRLDGDALTMPGPVDPERFLGLCLKPGALEGVRGMLNKAPGRERDVACRAEPDAPRFFVAKTVRARMR